MIDGLLERFALLHLIRPWWLLALPVIALLWWRIRPHRGLGEVGKTGIAPHLAQAMTVGGDANRRVFPIDLVAIVMVLLTFAVAGPTWSRLANPLLAQTAPLAVALEVTPSMTDPDLPPSRLERAKFKILDLIGRRAGARTALVAYAGSAHRVAPLTEDPNILSAMLEGLSPEVMPVEGDNATDALTLALGELQKAETPGAVLFVLDDLNPADIDAFSNTSETRAPVIFLVAASEAVKVSQIESIPNSSVVRMSADDSDLVRVERLVLSAYREALLEDERLVWNDKGWILAIPAMLLVAFWFRRGWTMRWAVAVALMLPMMSPGAAQAEGWKDWFLTPDQQGYLAYRDKRFADAGALFQDPAWRAFAQFRAGQYEEAAESYARMDTAEAAFGEGMARLRNRQYRDGVRAFERALELRPDYPEAQHNLEVAQAIVDEVEAAQEASDTGEETGIGADEVVFDNESGKGADSEITEEDAGLDMKTADQWMRSVDTRMGDFLKSRFLLENAGPSQ